MPKVSIVLPVYNVAAYVEQCARSLFEQTLDDIEIIFVDDCTPDNSIDIIRTVLKEYPTRESQVRIVRNQQNSGLAVTRWNGVVEAKGEYVLFVDSDDYIDLSTAEKLYSKAVSSNADMVLYDCIRYTPKYSEVKRFAPNGVIGDGSNLRDEMLNRESVCYLTNRMVRRELFSNPNLVWPKHGMAEDVVASSVLSVLAQKIDYLPEALYHYRFNPSSITRSRSEQQLYERYRQYLENGDILFRFLENQGVTEKYEMGVVRCKMAIRNQLAEIVNKPQYRKLWLSTFPELNRIMFWGNKNHPGSFKNMIWYLGMATGIYPRLRRFFLSKRFRPSQEWRMAILIKPE